VAEHQTLLPRTNRQAATIARSPPPGEIDKTPDDVKTMARQKLVERESRRQSHEEKRVTKMQQNETESTEPIRRYTAAYLAHYTGHKESP